MCVVFYGLTPHTKLPKIQQDNRSLLEGKLMNDKVVSLEDYKKDE